MSDIPEVLFVCTHNAGRSQMAAALLDHQAAGRVRVTSAGSQPASQLNPAVVQAMAEIGLDISREYPKPLTTGNVQAADVVITMGCGDACPVYPGKRYLDWDLPDPAGPGSTRSAPSATKSAAASRRCSPTSTPAAACPDITQPSLRSHGLGSANKRRAWPGGRGLVITVDPVNCEAIYAELRRVRVTFRRLVEEASPDDLARASSGTRWTNQWLLFHMLFGYLITRALIALAAMFTRLPARASRVFAGLLNAATGPFDRVGPARARQRCRVAAPLLKFLITKDYSAACWPEAVS